MDWEPPAGSVLAQRGEILEKNHVEVGQLTNCSICHR
jgi:hypothetical protein